MVSGEYAVLEGAPAVVAAVDRRARAQVRGPGEEQAGAEARAAYAQVERALGELGHEPAVDVTALRTDDDEYKLGLGSSAAAAAAAAGLAFAEHGRDVGDSRAQIFEAALRGHQKIAPQGSGADVAASVHGGFVRFQKRGGGVAVEPLRWPAQLRARVVWTGVEARTSTFLERVGQLAEDQPDVHRKCMGDLVREAERFCAALSTGDVSQVLTSTDEYGKAMGKLGEAAGIDIMIPKLQQLADLAKQAGGAAKPSGAGGGDVALALFPDANSEQQFEALCHEHNFTLLLISLGAPGVRTEGDLHGEAV